MLCCDYARQLNEFVSVAFTEMNSHQIHRTYQARTNLTKPGDCNAWGISQTSHKPKAHSHSGADKCTAVDLGWLDADNDYQSCQRFLQTSERMRFGWCWNKGLL